tara:strand:+ start:705 stop:947 length:243 start_codon:yes stop_codon:yes gene_type:complete
MTENTKSLIRHLLTMVGTILGLAGLNDFVPILDFLINSLDGVWDALIVILGFATTIFGFTKDPNRHAEREAGVAATSSEK